jgi:hypothetical protein
MIKRELPFTPRLIRHRDAPDYLGMDKNRFNQEVRPYICEIRLGKQGIAFDRLDLDAWVDQYKARNGRSTSKFGGNTIWDAKETQGLEIATEFGISRSKCSAKKFAKALAQATSEQRN